MGFSSVKEALTAIAENIRKFTGGGKMSLDMIASKIPTVWGLGKQAGKQAEYDAFWDKYQEYGNRVDCDYMFAGIGWNDETFKPKYDIKPTTVTNIFNKTGITDLVARLEECGVVLDLSNCSSGTYLASTSDSITTFPVADCRKRTGIYMTYLFYNCKNLRVIEKVILKEDGSQDFGQYSFAALPGLEEIRFEGTIGSNKFNISDSKKLSHESLMSIINALKDYSGSGTNYTVTLGATNLAKLTDAEKAIASDKGWTLA